VRGSGVGEFTPTQNPLTPTLSPPGRGRPAGADEEDGGDVGPAAHYPDLSKAIAATKRAKRATKRLPRLIILWDVSLVSF
jgi:hypothetical protein